MMYKKSIRYILIIMIISIIFLFTGCLKDEDYSLYSEYQITSQSNIIYHESLSRELFLEDQKTWDMIQELIPKEYELYLGQQIKYDVPGFDKIKVIIDENKMDVNIYIDFSEKILTADILHLEKDVYNKYIKPTKVVLVDDTAAISIDDIKEIKDYSIIFMENNFIPLDDVDTDEMDIGLDIIIPQRNVMIKEPLTEHIRVPGRVYYLSDNFKVVDYNILTGQTLLTGSTKDEDTCILFKYDIPLTLRILILGAAVLLLTLLIVLIASKLTSKKAPAKKQDGVLIGLRGKYKGVDFPIEDNEVIVLGRDVSVCHIIYDETDEMISRKHCSIEYNASKQIYTIYDYSSNGIFNMNDEKLSNTSSNILSKGTVIYLGNRENIYRLG